MIDTSPALQFQSEHYPASWHGKVPKRVRMAKTVRPDIPISESLGIAAKRQKEYEVWVNSHGAVSAICENGKRLGLRPYEFEVIEWHQG